MLFECWAHYGWGKVYEGGGAKGHRTDFYFTKPAPDFVEDKKAALRHLQERVPIG